MKLNSKHLRIVAAGAALSLTFAVHSNAIAQHVNANANQSYAANMLMPDQNVLPNIPQPCTLMFHGLTRAYDQFQGTHQLRIKIYNALGSLLKEETVNANIQHGSFDVTLPNMPPAIRMRTEKITVGVAIDTRRSRSGRSRSSMRLNSRAMSLSVMSMRRVLKKN